MNTKQRSAVEWAALDLAYAVRCQRDCELFDEKHLLAALQDLCKAFPKMGINTKRLINELSGVQA